MPTYEYKCSACGHGFERFHSIKAAPITKCPECGKNKVQRLIGTGAGLIFKGSGFYITDYRSDNYKSAAKADGGSTSGSNGSAAAASGSGSNASSSGGGSATGESKPAAKPKAEPKTKTGGK